MSFVHVLVSLCRSTFGASAPHPRALQKVTAVVRNWSLTAVCDLGNAACDSCEEQRMRATGGKAVINCKKLVAVNPAGDSFKFGPKSWWPDQRQHSVVITVIYYIDPLIPTLAVHVHFVSFFLWGQMFRSITCLLCLGDKPIELLLASIQHHNQTQVKSLHSRINRTLPPQPPPPQFLFCNLVPFPLRFHVCLLVPLLLPNTASTAGNQQSSVKHNQLD